MDLAGSHHDLVTYYCFWSLFYALGPMIWFYPLNDLDITGYEAFVVVLLIPVITAVEPLRRLLGSVGGLFVLLTSMLIGILSFHAPTTWWRLAILSFGNGGAMLYLSVRLFSGAITDRYRHFWLLLSGNFFFVASRILTRTIAPAWANREMNLAVAGIFGVSIILWIAGHLRRKPEAKEVDRNTGKSAEIRYSPGFFRQIQIGLSFGSTIYLTHWLFGELGVLSRWSVRGVPDSGPSPFHSAPFVLASLITGSFIPLLNPKFTSSLTFWLMGTGIFFATYFLDGYPEFLCGLGLAVFCSILWVNAMGDVISGHPAVILSFGMVAYLAEIFFHVWTVAYNFVPGGVYTREHSDYIIGFMSLTFLGSVKREKTSIKKNERPKSITAFFALAFAVAIFGTCLRLPAQPTDSKVLDPSTRQFSALIWTFHFGYDNQGWPSLRRAADLLRKTDADVIALLESDASKPYLGLNDLGLWLSEELGMFLDFGPATKDHTWGNLLLSKYPIIKSNHHLLPSPYGELAPAISATLNISGNLVDIISTHMGNDRDSEDRKVQATYLASIAAKSANPVVFLGYVTSSPGSRDYVEFTTRGGLKDIDPSDKSRFCEYILYKKLRREGYARISHGGLSDTELQLARFSLHADHDNDVIEVDSSKVAAWKRFSGDFGGYTVGHYAPWEHHYHMSTPKYFVESSKRN